MIQLKANEWSRSVFMSRFSSMTRSAYMSRRRGTERSFYWANYKWFGYGYRHESFCKSESGCKSVIFSKYKRRNK